MAPTLDVVLAELLERLRALKGGAVDVAPKDLRGWPDDVVAALLASGLLMPGKPADSIVCDGCNEACARPVHVVERPSGKSAAFILCDRRDDIDRVPVALDDLARWRVTVQSLADAMSGLLGSGKAIAHGGTGGGYRLGFVQGRKDRAMLHLRVDAQGLHLVLADHVLALQDALMLRDGCLALDQRLLARRVDMPNDAASAVPAESQVDMGLRLLLRRRELLAAGTKNFVQVIASEEGCSGTWVKHLIRNALKPSPFAGLGGQSARAATVSAPKKHPR